MRWLFPLALLASTLLCSPHAAPFCEFSFGKTSFSLSPVSTSFSNSSIRSGSTEVFLSPCLTKGITPCGDLACLRFIPAIANVSSPVISGGSTVENLLVAGELIQVFGTLRIDTSFISSS